MRATRTSALLLVRMGLIAVAVSTLLRPSPLVSAFSTKVSAALGRTVTVSTVVYASSSSSSSNKKNKNRSNNPSFANFIGGMASSILSNKTPDRKPQLDQKMVQVEPSWESLRSRLEALQTEEERLFRTVNVPKGYGVGSPLHKVRLFHKGNQEQDIRVTFYRDSASWCPYCQKVWMTLEEKQIPYRVEKVNMRCYGSKPASFTRMQPSGQIPVAIIDGQVFGQSNDILARIEEAFPEHKSLRPPAPGQEQRAQELLRLERQLFSAWMYWLTSKDTSSQQYKGMFTETLREVERALSKQGPFFMGKDVTLVDFQYAPFLERMAASLLYYKGFPIRVAPGAATDFPAVNRWFDAMETLPSYQLTKSDYYTHCWDLPPQLGGCVSEPAGEPYARAINGETDGSWELPLQPHNGGVEPDWAWAARDGDSEAQREAVERVSANFDAIVQFAARGAGRQGMPPVSAPLADPNAVPSDAVLESVSASLRLVCAALLEGSPDQYDASMAEIGATLVQDGGSEFASKVVDSLAYLRDRVGVPRDMKLPAARQLRAYLNWSIGKILEAQDS